MFPKIGKVYLILLAAAIVIGGATAACKYAGVFKLKRVTVMPEGYADSKRINLPMEHNLFALPIEEAADQLLKKGKVIKVDIDYSLPDGIEITINDIRPCAFVIDDGGQTLFALDDRCYLLPYNDRDGELECPLITGLKRTKAYSHAADRRLPMIIEQLEWLKDDSPDFYLALSCMDLSNDDYVSLYIDGLPFPIDVNAGSIYDRIRDLEIFLLDFNPDLSDVTRLDMRCENLIISAS
ncbi:MAG: hypothetical protein AB1746_14840 [Candidatus Zixiibacteriota bacterium]